MKEPATFKKSGVMLFTIENGELIAHLQERGTHNYKDNHRKPVSWPKVCQPTAEGKMHADGDPILLAIRKVDEELSVNRRDLMTWHALLEDLHQHVIYRDSKVTTYGLLVPTEVIKHLHLLHNSGGFRHLREIEVDDIICTMPADREKMHHHGAVDIVAFPEVIKALRAGFKKFKKHVTLNATPK